MAAQQPACFLSRTLELRKGSMCLSISHGDKGFHQRSDRQFALRMLPALRDHLAILIKKQIGEIRIFELAGQHR